MSSDKGLSCRAWGWESWREGSTCSDKWVKTETGWMPLLKGVVTHESALCTWNGSECPGDCLLGCPAGVNRVVFFFFLCRTASLPGVLQGGTICSWAAEHISVWPGCGSGYWCPIANESTSLLIEIWEKCRKKVQKTAVCMQKMLFNPLPSVEAESQSDKNQHFPGTVLLEMSVFCHTLSLSA